MTFAFAHGGLSGRFWPARRRRVGPAGCRAGLIDGGYPQASRKRIQLVERIVGRARIAGPHLLPDLIALEHDVFHSLGWLGLRSVRPQRRVFFAFRSQAQGLQDQLELIESIDVAFLGGRIAAESG